MLFAKIFKSFMFRSFLHIFALSIFMLAVPCRAQVKDSIQKALTYKPRFVFGLNSRVSTVYGNPSKTMRLFAGLDYNKKMRFEFAINAMPDAAVDVSMNDIFDTVTRSHKLFYWGLQAEYTFLRKGHWKLSYPLQVGWGVNHSTLRFNQEETLKSNDIVVPMEGGLDVLYYFYDWIGIKAGMGVRMSFGKSFSTLSGPYYNLGIALYAGELYRKIKDKKGS